MCVASVHYSVVVNNDEVGPIIPGRGLRQGDPLSPHLFFICAEGLTSLIRKAGMSGAIRGTRICGGAPTISHLFANVSFLFLKAFEREFLAMKEILNTYEQASGQSINLLKSYVMFSSNVCSDDRVALSSILCVVQSLDTGRYLGLPSLVGRNRKATFGFIKYRIWQKISSWKTKSLSMASRVVLIKSVTQAIPSYCLSMHLIPSSFGEEIQRMLNSFWWGLNNTTSKGIKWLDWDKLSIPKKFGGMGFQNLYAFNLVMLGKQVWKFIQCPNALVTRVFKSKYFPHNDFLEAAIGH